MVSQGRKWSSTSPRRCSPPSWQRKLYSGSSATITVFSAYVYNERPRPGEALRFEFGRRSNGGKADCWFDFKLGFSGWRTCTP